MPNGGSDCCATCWFNAKNDGEAGYAHAGGPGDPFCTIRALPVADAFYTYCGNHPHRRPERDPIPIGPVYTGDAHGNRQVWRASPDTEAIRRHLLELLDAVQERPDAEYPLGTPADEIVVWQLGEFREPRAAERLRRIAGFDSTATAPGPFGRAREGLVQLASEALETIEDGPAGRAGPRQECS
jgi:hypothetical protein